jgi:hypothetical protein
MRLNTPKKSIDIGDCLLAMILLGLFVLVAGLMTMAMP